MPIGKHISVSRVRKWLVDHRLDLSTLLVSIVAAVVVNLPAFLTVNSDKAKLNILSLDEWGSINFLHGSWYNLFSWTTLGELVTLHDQWGYGTIFWYVYGIIGLPAHWFGSFTAELMTYRILSAVWLGVSMWLVYKIVIYFKQPAYRGWIAAATVLALPGFYFYEKPFSAEFLHLSLCLTALYLFLLYLGHGKKRLLYWAAAVLGVAIGVKISALVFAPVVLLAWLWHDRQTTVLQATKTLGWLTLAAAAGFFLANPYILLLRRAGVEHYYAMLQLNLTSNATNHGLSVEGIGLGTWYRDVILVYFYPQWYLILAAVGLLFVLYQQRQRLLPLFAVVTSCSLYIFYILFSVKKMWLWYLYPGILVVPIILGLIQLRRRWANVIVPALILLLFFLSTWPTVQSRITAMQQRESEPGFQGKVQAKQAFDDWLAGTAYAGTFLKSPYIYFDETKFTDRVISVVTIWGSMAEWNFTSYQPTLLLIQKNYGFLLPDEAIADRTTYQQLLVERQLYQTVITTGLNFEGQYFHYSLVHENDSFYVYARD